VTSFLPKPSKTKRKQLLAFNVGIEVSQLIIIFVFVVLAA